MFIIFKCWQNSVIVIETLTKFYCKSGLNLPSDVNTVGYMPQIHVITILKQCPLILGCIIPFG